MKKLKLKDLSLMLMIPVINIIYTFLNNENRGCISLVTQADKRIPFIKIFVIPYILWYPFIFACMVYFLQKEKRIYYRALFSLLIGYLCCYTAYFGFQTYVPRPKVNGSGTLNFIINIVYSSDKPYNCFPSIHVLSCFIMIIAIFNIKNASNKSKIIITLFSILIILSTQFIKQHVLLDVISAIILGVIVYCICRAFDWEELLWQKKSFLLLMMKKKSEI